MTSASPSYYYDHETAFLINYAVDPTFGGIYTAVDANGALIPGPLPVQVWGFPAGTIFGTDKSLLGQATCIRYFITEYQRTSTLATGTSGINRLLNGGTTVSPTSLLNYARSCADTVISYLEIPPADNVSEANFTGFFPTCNSQTNPGPCPDQGDTVIPNRLFYWASVSRDHTTRYIDDTTVIGTGSAARSESVVAWSMAELALALTKAGQGAAAAPYLAAALRWWNWRQTTAGALPPYGNPALPAQSGDCSNPNLNPNNCIPGIGRDVFYPALGFTLSEVTGSAAYRNAAIAFANAALGTGNVPDLTYPPPNALQDSAYVAGYGRAILFAKHAQQGLGTLADRDQWWDFGNYPAQQNGTVSWNPATNPGFTRLGQPFSHFAGREVVAGTERAFWFFYTFGQDPNIFYAPGFGAAGNINLQNAVLAYWNFANATFWDNTAGQQAWFEARGQPYKPCFSGGTDVPIGDWLPPRIVGKIHTINPDRSATITVRGVQDPAFPYLNWTFRGSGIGGVDVVYTADNGATWNTIDAVVSATNPADYTALIPPQPANAVVSYYARAHDNFNNWTAFPAGAETWDPAGVSQGRNIALAQHYDFNTPVVVAPAAVALSVAQITPTVQPTATASFLPATGYPPVAPTNHNLWAGIGLVGLLLLSLATWGFLNRMRRSARG